MVAKKKATKKVAKRQATAVAVPINFADDANAGMEEADQSSFAIPFLSILQSGSPQVESVKAAKAGMFINTITEEVAFEVLVIPCSFRRRYIAWEPRDVGGAYKGEYSPTEVELGRVEGLIKEGTQYMVGTAELRDTRNHYVLVQFPENDVWAPAMMSLSSTQVKKSKRWMSRIQGIELRDGSNKTFTPPSFSHIYKLTTDKESNEKGNWHGLTVELVGPVENAELYEKAKAFHGTVVADIVEVAAPTDDRKAGEDIPL